VIRLLQGQLADLPAAQLGGLVPLLSSGPLAHDAKAVAAVAGQQVLALVAADGGRAWINGHSRPDLTLRHIALRQGTSLDLVVASLRALIAGTSPCLTWAPAGIETAPLGFWRFVNGCRLAFPPGKPALSATAGLTVLTAADADSLEALARGRCQQLDGPGDWQAETWRRRTETTDGGWLGYAQAGELTGALRVTFDRREAMVQARVTSLVDRSPEAFAGLMGYVAHLTTTGADVQVDTLPPDRPGVALGDIVSKQRAGLDRSWAVRVGGPDAWLPALRYTASGEIRFAVDDPLGLWPAAIALRWRDGRLTDWSVAADADLHLRIDALMGLYAGQLTPDHLTYRDWLRGPTEAFGALLSIWEGQPLHRFGWDQP
jgi:hypothetical protein